MCQIVQYPFSMSFGVEGHSSVSVDEDEFRTQNKASSVSIRSHWYYSPTTEIIVDFTFPRDHPSTLMRSEVNTAGNNERVLMFFA